MYSQPGFGLPALSVFIRDELFAFKSYNLFLLSRYSNGSLPPILITSKLVTYPYINIIERPHYLLRHAVAQLVEALRYKPKGRGFDSRFLVNDVSYDVKQAEPRAV